MIYRMAERVMENYEFTICKDLIYLQSINLKYFFIKDGHLNDADVKPYIDIMRYK